MAESSSSPLRIWDGFPPGVPGAPLSNWGEQKPLMLPDAEQLARRETMRGPGKGRLGGGARRTGTLDDFSGADPFSLQWFLDIENTRHGRQGSWIPHLLEFTRHAGETILGLGYGLGTDWVQYARHNSQVVVCCPAADQLALIRRNFELRGLSGTFLHASPVTMPLEACSIDVACVSGLLHEVPDPEQTTEEIYRVLKPGGKVIVVVPARYDVEFWCRLCFPWRSQSASNAQSSGTPWPLPPQARRFTAGTLRQLFARFSEPRLTKRHLRRGDLPHLWRWCPLPLLERFMGRLLVFKAFKPLRAATVEQAAA